MPGFWWWAETPCMLGKYAYWLCCIHIPSLYLVLLFKDIGKGFILYQPIESKLFCNCLTFCGVNSVFHLYPLTTDYIRLKHNIVCYLLRFDSLFYFMTSEFSLDKLLCGLPDSINRNPIAMRLRGTSCSATSMCSFHSLL